MTALAARGRQLGTERAFTLLELCAVAMTKEAERAVGPYREALLRERNALRRHLAHRRRSAHREQLRDERRAEVRA